MQIPVLVFDESGWCKSLGKAYMQGPYQPTSKEEYEALAPFARQPVAEINSDETGKEVASLVEEALALGVPGTDGKPAPKSVLVRWSKKRLQEAIAEAKLAIRKAYEAKALELGLGTAEAIAALSDEDLTKAIAEAEAEAKA